ncbi:unnamed protein product [Cuscuta epithymum]|uniref:Uncharacterized protein n=1 Tax=Cuscuta epithymum TaxID=186058 RepID=A0AAV0EAB5_9ASTE|nr:unnamed protein product [Cuscuta epithymum]
MAAKHSFIWIAPPRYRSNFLNPFSSTQIIPSSAYQEFLRCANKIISNKLYSVYQEPAQKEHILLRIKFKRVIEPKGNFKSLACRERATTLKNLSFPGQPPEISIKCILSDSNPNPNSVIRS